MPRQETDGSLRERRLTARGAATRDRIVQAAADLMYVKGVNATTLDDVIAASGVSKSQLYWHFPGKEDLVHAVIALRGQQVLGRENQRLQRRHSFRGLVRWRNALIQATSLQNGAYGCALGSMGTAPCVPGSFLVISHPASDIDPEQVAEFARRFNEGGPDTMIWRDRTTATGLFGGLELIETGVVPTAKWRPESELEASSPAPCGPVWPGRPEPRATPREQSPG